MSSEPVLRGRHAFITGGSRGIGAAIARTLARLGADISIMGRNVDPLDAFADELRDEGHRVAAVAADLTDEYLVRTAFERAADVFGPPYILVNNAGQAEGSLFLDTTRELWDRMLAINLTGAYLCIQQVLGAMLDAGAGRIVNIASTSGLRGYRNVSAYCAAKHGLVGLTRALAAETARAGITVNAVCPGYTATDMTDSAVHTIMRDMKRTEDEARAMIARTIPRGTLIEPREVASVVAWLCSPDASGVTGQAIVVAGGEI